MLFYLFPGLFYVIFCIPGFLAYDFGIYFLGYLRGVGKSPTFMLELGYDYIAFAIFHIRLVVQNIRLVLMFFTYIGMHDLILFFNMDQKLIVGNDSI
jgi:hypothetical protein